MKVIVKEDNKLYRENKLSQFLEIPFTKPNALSQSTDQLKNKKYKRSEIFEILLKYNNEIENDNLALENLQKLKLPDSHCVVTGQQLGLLGGPSYTILKGISCLLLARETNSIPIFWLATEDHDIAEIDHTYSIDALGNIQKLHFSFPCNGCMVEDLFFNAHHQELITSLIDWKGELPIFTAGESYSLTMAKYLVKIFAGTGLVFLEPKILRKLAIPFLEYEIINSHKIHNVLQTTTEMFLAEGGKPSLKIEEGTNLFYKNDHDIRTKVYVKGDTFILGSQKLTEDQIIQLIHDFPERFSTNVAARPVLQSLLLPTIAYIAGPTELNYYHQLKEYHHLHGINMPVIVPRISATLIPAYATSLLEKCGLNPWENISRHWDTLIPGLDDGLEEMMFAWQEIAREAFSEDLTPEAIMGYVRNGARKIQNKVRKIRLKRKNIPSFALHLLRNLIHPHNTSQERVLNWSSLQAITNENLVQEFLKLNDWRPKGHLWCFLA